MSENHGQGTCSVIQAMASMTRATISERRMARNALFTDKASVALPDDAMDALLLIPAVSISRNFCKMSDLCIKLLKAVGIQKQTELRVIICSLYYSFFIIDPLMHKKSNLLLKQNLDE